MLYLDNAATTFPKPPSVLSAMRECCAKYCGNPGRGGHTLSMRASETVYSCREALAEQFGSGHPENTVFTLNATAALNLAVKGLAEAGDHILISDIEHNAVRRPVDALAREGRIRYDVFPSYAADPELTEEKILEGIRCRIRPETRLLVCTHASNLTGDLLDAARIAKIAHAHGALLILDASQTAGAIPIDMTALGVDVLCFTGHKGLMGPQGTGGLCIAPRAELRPLVSGVDIRPLLRGGSGVHSFDREQPQDYPTRLEAGTLNSHGIAGLEAAADYLLTQGVETVEQTERALMQRFYEGVRRIDGITVYGDFSLPRRAAIVALNLRDWDSAEVSDALYTDYGIATRPGAHCAPRLHQALGTTAQGAVRFSFSAFNTEAEVDAAIRAVRELAGAV